MPALLLLLFWIAPIGQSGPSRENQPVRNLADVPSRGRSYTQIDRDISAFLRNEALATSDFSHAAAIRDLCSLAIEVRFHPQFESSLMMQTLKNRICSRLKKIAQKTAREYRNSGLSDDQIILAEVTRQPDVDRILLQNMQLAGFAVGGPHAFFSQTHGANRGGIIEENAGDLIRLIQSTIDPEFWDVNGGVGTIVFYSPLNALVVRATEDIHYQIGGILGQLRSSNR